MQRRGLCLLPFLGAWAGGGAVAQPAPVGETPGRVILRVSGLIEGDERAFDLVALEALGRQPLRTRTIWTGAAILDFQGVPLSLLLRAVGARGQRLRATALNDYAIDLPVEDADRHGAFLATRQDGQPIRVRDRGPVWLVYPWSDRPELDTPRFRDRAIWQLRHIDVL